MSQRPVVGISLGDVSGIGPEVTAAALALPRVRRALVPVVFGDGPTLERLDRKSTRLNSSHSGESRMPSSA